MSNTYTFHGPGTRWIVGDATAYDYMNVSRENMDHIHEALNTIMDTDAADGLIDGTVEAYPLSPWKVEVDSGVNWTNAFWQSADNRWWWLWNTADVASFTRADAEFYFALADINDVPTS